MADSSDLAGRHFTQPLRRYRVVSDICHAQRIPFRTDASHPKLTLASVIEVTFTRDDQGSIPQFIRMNFDLRKGFIVDAAIGRNHTYSVFTLEFPEQTCCAGTPTPT